MEKVLIWDLDGILINSYPVMISSLKKTLLEKGIRYNIFEILDYIQMKSVKQFIEKISFIYNVSMEELWERYVYYEEKDIKNITLHSNARETLDLLHEQGVNQYVYTNKGREALQILEEFSLTSYFTEIVTSENGFYRKPHPDGITYLMTKYELYENHDVYYVGFRPSDIECAYYADINSILLVTNQDIKGFDKKPSYVIRDLLELEHIIPS